MRIQRSDRTVVECHRAKFYFSERWASAHVFEISTICTVLSKGRMHFVDFRGSTEDVEDDHIDKGARKGCMATCVNLMFCIIDNRRSKLVTHCTATRSDMQKGTRKHLICSRPTEYPREVLLSDHFVTICS